MYKIKYVLTLMLISVGLVFGLKNIKPSYPITLSEVKVSVGSGYGSTGVYIRTFSTVDVNTGSGITYTSDSVNGDYFTVNISGVYSITYSDGYGYADYFGISVDSSTTTPVTSLTTAQRLCFVTVLNSDSDCQSTYYLVAGDKVRAHWTVGGSTGIVNPQAYSTLTIIQK